MDTGRDGKVPRKLDRDGLHDRNCGVILIELAKRGSWFPRSGLRSAVRVKEGFRGSTFFSFGDHWSYIAAKKLSGVVESRKEQKPETSRCFESLL